MQRKRPISWTLMTPNDREICKRKTSHGNEQIFLLLYLWNVHSMERIQKITKENETDNVMWM